jgi:hypothetical protein
MMKKFITAAVVAALVILVFPIGVQAAKPLPCDPAGQHTTCKKPAKILQPAAVKPVTAPGTKKLPAVKPAAKAKSAPHKLPYNIK